VKGDLTMHEFQTHCPECQSQNLVNLTPWIAGPVGWGQRCKDCGWHVTDVLDEEELFDHLFEDEEELTL
jgi:transposase-like protein